jgi:hypothetical protein
MTPEEPRIARVVARVYIAPSFVTSLLQAISANAFRQEDAVRQTREEEQDDGHSDET